MFNTPTRKGFSVVPRVQAPSEEIIMADISIRDKQDGTYADVKNDGTDNALVVVQNIVPETAVTGTFWQDTQPVSGTFWQDTQPVSIAANVDINLHDGAGTALTSTLVGADQSLDVNITNASIAVTGTFWQVTQPVSGTVTADAGTGLNQIETKLNTSNGHLSNIAACASGSEMQCDVIAALPTGTNIIGAVKQDIVNWTAVHKDDQQTTAQTNTDLWTPAGGKKFVLTDIIVSVDTAMTVTFLDEAAKIIEVYLAANGGFTHQFKTPYPSATADNDLKYTTSTDGKISITVEGYEI